MRVFATGLSGFIGKHVERCLKKKKIAFIKISRKKNKNNFSLKINMNKDLGIIDKKIKTKQNDVLLHMAWQGLPNHNSKHHLTKNLKIHKIFLKKMIKLGFKKIIITGTCAEVGKKNGSISVNVKTNPLNNYGKAKDLLRKWLFKNYKNALTIIWLRIFYVYGEGQHNDSIYGGLLKALREKKNFFKMSEGNQKRDFIKVENVARDIIKIVLKKKTNSRIINISSGKSIKVKTFVKNLLKKLNKKIEIKYGFHPYNPKESMNFWGIKSKI